jgi:S-DNA-T family DNA segregation ATPase FtsK/SpoIIIE
MTYGLLLRSRDHAWDLCLAPFLTAVFLSAGFYLYPEFLGHGLYLLLVNYASDFALLTTLFLSLAGCFVVAFRGAFFETIISGAQTTQHALAMTPSLFKNFRPLAKLSEGAGETKQSLLSYKLKLRDALRGEPKTELPRQITAVQDSPKTKEQKPVFTFNKKQEVAPPATPPQEDATPKPAAEEVSHAQRRAAPSPSASAQHEDYKKIVAQFAQKERSVENSHPDDEYFHDIINRIEEKLGDFGIDGKIINILKGPVVDTFELETGPGVKVSKINGIQDDLTMALMGAPIRIVYPMPQ